MSDPRIPEAAIRAAIDDIDELAFIDRGSQGDAWRIRRNGGGDEVLKVIVGADSARVAREVKTMQAVNDPHVMRFTEAGSLTHAATVHACIIGEYVPGDSIATKIQAGDWPIKKEALACRSATLRGLAAIHAQEVVHRDVKPGNIALRNNDWGDPVILDLGLVRDLLGDSITVYPNLLGTVPFMAPEQLRSERAVRRSDVFAAGVTLFVLLTQRHPFPDAGEQAVPIEVLEERVSDDDRPKWDDVSGSRTTCATSSSRCSIPTRSSGRAPRRRRRAPVDSRRSLCSPTPPSSSRSRRTTAATGWPRSPPRARRRARAAWSPARLRRGPPPWGARRGRESRVAAPMLAAAPDTRSLEGCRWRHGCRGRRRATGRPGMRRERLVG